MKMKTLLYFAGEFFVIFEAYWFSQPVCYNRNVSGHVETRFIASSTCGVTSTKYGEQSYYARRRDKSRLYELRHDGTPFIEVTGDYFGLIKLQFKNLVPGLIVLLRRLPAQMPIETIRTDTRIASATEKQFLEALLLKVFDN